MTYTRAIKSVKALALMTILSCQYSIAAIIDSSLINKAAIAQPNNTLKAQNHTSPNSLSVAELFYRDNKDYITICISLTALSISLSGFLIAFLNYRRKSGVHIRSSFTVSSGIDCDDPYVSSVLLVNEKDRACTILGIHLQIGSNVFIELDEFQESPLILKGYETWGKSYGPLEFYSISGKRYDFQNAFENKRYKRKIVLETTIGKYITKPIKSYWSPMMQFFVNYLTAPAKIVVSQYEGENIGGNCKYLVVLTHKTGPVEKLRICKSDFKRDNFRNFKLPEEAYETKQILKKNLEENLLRAEGSNVTSIEVIDCDESRKIRFTHHDLVTKEIKPLNWFMYAIIGTIGTKFQNIKMRRSNSISAKRQKILTKNAVKSLKNKKD